MREARNKRNRDESQHGQLLIRIIGHLFLMVLVMTVFLTLVQCSVESPEAPSWNTELVVPLVNRTYDMRELVNKMDQDEITMDSLGNVYFSIREELDTIRLGEDELQTDPISYNLSQPMGNVNITAPSIAPITTAFGDIAGLSDWLSGNLLPPVGFTVFNNIPDIESFSTASITQGTAMCIITNNMDVTLDQVDVYLDDVSGSVVVLITSGSLANDLVAGSIDTVLLPLAGETLPNQLQVRVACHTPGGTIGDPASLSVTTELAFAADLEVSSAVAQIPDVDPISFGQSVGLSLDSGESIADATLATGNLSLVLTNNSPLSSQITLNIEQLLLGGQSLVIDTSVASNATVTIGIDLSGYHMVPSQNSINISGEADPLGSGTELVTINATDDFGVSADLTALTFSSVTGTFSGTEAPLDDMHEELDIPDGFDDIGLRTAVLTIEIDNGVDLPGILNITLTGDNAKVLNIVGDIAEAGLAASSRTTITNPDIADFLNPVPEAIDISGSCIFGGESYQGTVSTDDFIVARIRIEAPLDLVFDSTVINDIDLEKEEIDQEDIGAVIDQVLNAEFNYIITNHLPLGITATLLLSGDSASLFAADPAQAEYPVLELEVLSVNPAPVSASGGSRIVSESLVSTGSVMLSQDDLDILENDTLFIRTLLALTSSETTGVRLTENDFLSINGYIQVEYEFDGGL